MKIVLENNYIISDIEMADANAYVEHLQEKEIQDHTLRIPYPYTMQDAMDWIEMVFKNTHRIGQSINWAIRNPEGQLIGGIGFHDFEIGIKVCEVDYWLAKPYWGKGIMPLAVDAVTKYAFENFELEKVTAHTADFNPRSGRVLEKAGFKSVGFQRGHYKKNGQAIDAIGYIKNR